MRGEVGPLGRCDVAQESKPHAGATVALVPPTLAIARWIHARRSSRTRPLAADLRRSIGRESYSPKALPATGKECGPLRLGRGARGTRYPKEGCFDPRYLVRGARGLPPHSLIPCATPRAAPRLTSLSPPPEKWCVDRWVRSSPQCLRLSRKRRDYPHEERRPLEKRDVRVARKRK